MTNQAISLSRDGRDYHGTLSEVINMSNESINENAMMNAHGKVSALAETHRSVKPGHLIAVFALFMCILMAMTAHTFAASVPGGSGQVDARIGLILRGSASTFSKIITVLPDNTDLVIYKEVYTSKTSTAKKNKWYYVKARGRKGYVRSDYVDNVRYGSVKAKVIQTANYRQGPGIEMTRKGTVSKGASVRVYMKANPVSSTKGSSKLWYRVRINGSYSYICSTNIRLTGKTTASSSASAAKSVATTSGSSSSTSKSGTTTSGSSSNKSGSSSSGNKNTASQTTQQQVSQVVSTASGAFNKMTATQFENYLTRQGFPEDYKKKLRVLHTKHPNWVFSAYKTGITWKDALKKETALRVSLVHKSYPKSYRLASRANSQVEPGWYNASETVVAYYMDPRNFLNEERIYMFENLAFESDYQTKDAVSRIISGTGLPSYGFTAQIFMNAGRKYNISPVFMAARVVQETGGNSVSVNGAKSGGTVVYNPFNIGATGSNPAAQGLVYARKQGWTTPAKAVDGGARYLASGYISKKQNSIYFQRFNVANGLSKVGTHQYMTNVMAPFSEALITKNSYVQMGITGEALGFIIPVYNSMPASTRLP